MEFSSVVPNVRNNVTGKVGIGVWFSPQVGHSGQNLYQKPHGGEKVGSFIFLGVKYYTCFSSRKGWKMIKHVGIIMIEWMKRGSSKKIGK